MKVRNIQTILNLILRKKRRIMNHNFHGYIPGINKSSCQMFYTLGTQWFQSHDQLLAPFNPTENLEDSTSDTCSFYHWYLLYFRNLEKETFMTFTIHISSTCFCIVASVVFSNAHSQQLYFWVVFFITILLFFFFVLLPQLSIMVLWVWLFTSIHMNAIFYLLYCLSIWTNHKNIILRTLRTWS